MQGRARRRLARPNSRSPKIQESTLKYTDRFSHFARTGLQLVAGGGRHCAMRSVGGVGEGSQTLEVHVDRGHKTRQVKNEGGNEIDEEDEATDEDQKHKVHSRAGAGGNEDKTS